MSDEGIDDTSGDPKVFPAVAGVMSEDFLREAYARHVAGRAAEPEPVTRLAVETARIEYLDKLEHLRLQGLDAHWPLTEEDRRQLEVLRLLYEALQERFAEQRRAAESAEASRVIASNTELAKRQTNYARVVMWVVILQAAIAAAGVYVAARTAPVSPVPPSSGASR